MKKLSIILALLVTFPAFAEDVTPIVRDNYVGFRLHKNENMEFKYSGSYDTTIKDEQFGFGATVGNVLTKNIRLEFETAYTGTSINKKGSKYAYDIWSNMINAYLFQNIGGAVAPYAGIGLGFAGIFSDVNAGSAHFDDTEFDLSWQFMVGVTFALNDRLGLDLGFKYQNYGDVSHSKSNQVYSRTDIDATEFYFGATYKFGL